MKKTIIKVLLSLLSILLVGILLHCTAIFHFPTKEGTSIAPILNTNWQQMGGFNKFTPQQDRIGCWGTTFAQILYHHRALPLGQVAYQTSIGTEVRADLESFEFNFNLFQSELNETSKPATIDQMAMYNYFAAAVVHKDFGTGNGSMIHMTKVGKELEKHYPVETDWYASIDGKYPYTPSKLECIVERELGKKRPLYFYFYDGGNKGHAVVIDGFRRENGKFIVHLIQGQGGAGNGWYDFHEPILHEGDTQTRVVYTLKPLAGKLTLAAT